MAEQKSFKERVKDTVIQNTNSYKRYFVDYEYLLCSEAFVNKEYYRLFLKMRKRQDK